MRTYEKPCLGGAEVIGVTCSPVNNAVWRGRSKLVTPDLVALQVVTSDECFNFAKAFAPGCQRLWDFDLYRKDPNPVCNAVDSRLCTENIDDAQMS